MHLLAALYLLYKPCKDEGGILCSTRTKGLWIAPN